MKCAGCGHENRDAAKFCEECAAPLGRKCAGCGAELRPVAKFCDECATLVTGAPPPRAAQAHRLFTEMGATGPAERIAALLAESAR
jgi:predicted amidophosphoribosyltransferase